MELKRVDSFLLKGLYVMVAAIVVTQTLGMGTVTSLLFTMTFPLTVLLWLRTVRRTVTGMDILMLLAVSLAIISVLLDAMRYNADLSFSYIKKLIMFTMTLLFFQSAYRISIDQNTQKFIIRLLNVLTVYLMLIYLARNVQMHTMNGMVVRYLTFRMSNPNLTGMYLSCLYMLQLYSAFHHKKWSMRLISLVFSVFLAWCVLETQSRTALLVIVLYTALYIWLTIRGIRNMCVTKPAAVVLAALPILVVIAYMVVVYLPWFNNLLGFMTSEGKALDSRMAVWEPAVKVLEVSPVIGSYYTISDGTGMSQMHNSHLDIAASYGIPVMCLVGVLLFRYLNQRGRRYREWSNYLYINGFACALLLGIGEAAIFSGGLGIYILAGTFLILANGEETKHPGVAK